MENTATIRGRNYSFGYLPPTEALGLELTIAQVIGGPLFKALAAGGSEEQDGAIALSALAVNLNPERLISNMNLVFKYVQCEGKRITSIDETFSGGRHGDVWEVFIYGLRYNFHELFPESLSTFFRERMKKAGSNLSIPPISTGT